MKKLSRGVLIAFEGIDGSGKTTQIQRVARFLQKQTYPVTVTHQPSHSSKWGRLIQEKVKKHREEVTPETELEWYVKDRKWDLTQNILPALEKKHVVLVDRYYLSNAAYQGALNTFSPEEVLQKNAFAYVPDLWLILDVTVPLGQARIRDRTKKKQNEDQLEYADYQEKVRANYKKLSKMNIGGVVEWIDAGGEEEELSDDIGSLILEFLAKF